MTRATELLEAGLELRRELADWRGVAVSLENVAWAAHRLGESARAKALYAESFSLCRQLNYAEGFGECLVGVGVVVGALGNLRQAARLFGAADAVYEAINFPQRGYYLVDYQITIDQARAQLGDEAYAAAFAEGKSLTPEQAFAEALGGSSTAEALND